MRQVRRVGVVQRREVGVLGDALLDLLPRGEYAVRCVPDAEHCFVGPSCEFRYQNGVDAAVAEAGHVAPRLPQREGPIGPVRIDPQLTGEKTGWVVSDDRMSAPALRDSAHNPLSGVGFVVWTGASVLDPAPNLAPHAP